MKGNFKWTDDTKTKVVFVPDANGKFEVIKIKKK